MSKREVSGFFEELNSMPPNVLGYLSEMRKKDEQVLELSVVLEKKK